jgi:DNA gyrase subunit A
MDEIQDRFDHITEIDIEHEMKRCFIDYSMSVIVARALPDARDGLKPVHRRILYAMKELNLEPTKPFRKSARIVGDTMGKYHPHGDSSIYDAMVRMAQAFSMRYPLVDGHGNFGSVDGDGAAAQRYTEARFTRMSIEMLADIEKNTVDFAPNFDETEKEPVVLPSRFPNLMVNGSSGIAVGMATNIPPHNLTEIIKAVVKIIDNHVIENRETDIDELLSIVTGPDFPTGATIVGRSGIRQAYKTGRGKIKLRADAVIEPMPHNPNREHIIVDAIPYQVNKAKLIESIAELVKDKRIEGISDLRDESNREGMRIVIELKRDVNANVVLNQLYKYTQMQVSFGIIMLALVNNEPKTLNLKEMLTCYIDHQKEVVTRRTQFDLAKAEDRAHILEGLRIALDNIDEVIAIIRSSRETSIAKTRLTERFGLSDRQTQAIVDMQLRRLTGLEHEKIEDEYAEIEIRIAEYKAILSDENKLYSVIREEISIIEAKYGDERKTKIIHDPGEINYEDLIEEGTSVVTMTHMGYIKRLPLNTYKSQNRGGKGIIGMQTREEDFIENLFITSTHNYMLFFTNLGRVYRIKAYEIPEAGRTARGTAIVNLLEISAGEKITAVISAKESEDDKYLLMVTKNGITKKTNVSQFKNIRKGGLIALTVREDDELISVKLTDGAMDILVTTKYGQGIRFSEEEIRAMGRTAAGVRSIRLNKDDVVIDVETISVDDNSEALIVSANGYGKRTSVDEFSARHRGGKGVKIYKITDKTGPIAAVNMINDNEDLMLITSEGTVIRLRAREISTYGRVTQGVRLMNLAEGVEVVGLAKIAQEDIEIEEDEEIVLEELNNEDQDQQDDFE